MNFEKELSLSEISKIINGKIYGKDVKIKGINIVKFAKENEITFADNLKYFELAQLSKASAIIVEKIYYNSNKPLILVENAINAYNKLVAKLLTPIFQEESINKNTVIDLTTKIHKDAYIGPYVTIGSNCKIYSGVKIMGFTKIGNNVNIYPGAVIGADPFYYNITTKTKILPVGNVVIEDNVEIGSNTVIERGLGNSTTIRKNSKIGSNVIIGSDAIIGENCLIAPLTGIGSNVLIEENVIVWGQVGINKNLVIGKNSVILGQSGVSRSLEGEKIYFGTPATEAHIKMKELALLKQLPDLIKILFELYEKRKNS